MQTKQLICINCPLGCPLSIQQNEDGSIASVSGNTCPRGISYAEKELTAPTRIVTSTVRVSGSVAGAATVSCKTRCDVPKAAIFPIVTALKDVIAPAPICIGDVLLADAAGTGVDVIATRDVR